ncbi:cytochrome c oxidase assembly protein (isoform 1) [Pedobacter sp. BAL39]|nr:cytochrome c oxidase assembly protein (isoform 1) [Pedobacter sp. BAL39]
MKDNYNRRIANWLYIGAACIIIQILLGGITRLTGSGLSITEWKPLLGSIPPLNESEWQASFDRYKQIAQFHLVNSHFTLEDYKSIFFWEWFHRNWARLLGVIFVLPLTYFLITKQISRTLVFPLIILLSLGLLQGVIGWIMVRSGLNDTDIRVNHIRLSIHFFTALILLCYTLWIAFSLSFRDIHMRHRVKYPMLNIIVLGFLCIQMVYGAFMAGTNAALAAITWPDMNGSFIPKAVRSRPVNLTSMTSDLLSIQFIHRNLAYLITILVIILYFRTYSWKINKRLSMIRMMPLLLVTSQCMLGIITLVSSIHPDHKIYALLHQSTGIMLMASLLLTQFMNMKRH